MSALLVGLTACLVVGVVAAVVASIVSGQLSSLRDSLAAARTRGAELEKEAVTLRRQYTQLQSERAFIAHFLREFPHLTRDLHTGGKRRIPDVLLNVVTRILEPREAVVLLRRRHAETDPARTTRLVAAAISPGLALKQGTEIAIGPGGGELGFVAEVQRSMDRQDFEAQDAPTKKKFRQEAAPGFEPDLAAPMVFGDETVGVIAVARPQKMAPEAKDVLRLIAQVGALAIHDVAAFAEMKVTADVDGLTRIFNKRHMTQVLGEAIFKAEQRAESLSVFLFDIDNFKHYKDANGHVEGDRLLQQLARLVSEDTRKENVFGRFGGEEFLLVLPGTTSVNALAAAEKIRWLIAAHPFAHAAKQPLGVVSISGGVAECPAVASDTTALLKAADEALYKAKHAGRNRVFAAAPHYLSDPHG